MELGALPPVEAFRNLPGVGVTGVVDGHEVEVGRRDGRITIAWASPRPTSGSPSAPAPRQPPER